MTEIKSNKKSVSKVALLLVILTMFLSIFIGVKPVTTYAETLENEQQITVETISMNWKLSIIMLINCCKDKFLLS